MGIGLSVLNVRIHPESPRAAKLDNTEPGTSADVFGLEQRGAVGDGDFRPSDGGGYVAYKNFTTKLPRTTLGTGLARTGTNTGSRKESYAKTP